MAAENGRPIKRQWMIYIPESDDDVAQWLMHRFPDPRSGFGPFVVGTLRDKMDVDVSAKRKKITDLELIIEEEKTQLEDLEGKRKTRQERILWRYSEWIKGSSWWNGRFMNKLSREEKRGWVRQKIREYVLMLEDRGRELHNLFDNVEKDFYDRLIVDLFGVLRPDEDES